MAGILFSINYINAYIRIASGIIRLKAFKTFVRFQQNFAYFKICLKFVELIPLKKAIPLLFRRYDIKGV